MSWNWPWQRMAAAEPAPPVRLPVVPTPPPPPPPDEVGPAAARVVELLGRPGWEPNSVDSTIVRRKGGGRWVGVSPLDDGVMVWVDDVVVSRGFNRAEHRAIAEAVRPVVAALQAARPDPVSAALADLAEGRVE